MYATLARIAAHVNDGIAWSPLHAAHAAAWKAALWGHAALVARMTGYRERELQAWCEPQTERPTPTERMYNVVTVLRGAGVPEATAIRPVRILAAELGYDLMARFDAKDVRSNPIETCSDVVRAGSEAVRVALDAIANKVTPEKLDRLRGLSAEVVTELRRLDAELAAHRAA